MATLGNISFNIKNEYAASATYLKDDIVHYNGHWHLCTTDTTAGQNPDTHPGSWDSWQSMFNWRGTYSHAGSTAYKVNDVVQIDVPLYLENKTGRMQTGQNFGGSNPYAGTAGHADTRAPGPPVFYRNPVPSRVHFETAFTESAIRRIHRSVHRGSLLIT